MAIKIDDKGTVTSVPPGRHNAEYAQLIGWVDKRHGRVVLNTLQPGALWTATDLERVAREMRAMEREDAARSVQPHD